MLKLATLGHITCLLSKGAANRVFVDGSDLLTILLHLRSVGRVIMLPATNGKRQTTNRRRPCEIEYTNHLKTVFDITGLQTHQKLFKKEKKELSRPGFEPGTIRSQHIACTFTVEGDKPTTPSRVPLMGRACLFIPKFLSCKRALRCFILLEDGSLASSFDLMDTVAGLEQNRPHLSNEMTYIDALTDSCLKITLTRL